MVDVEVLQRENAQLREQLARVVDSNQTLTEQIAKFNDRITELLAVAQRRQRKPAAAPAPMAPPAVTGEAKQTFDERPKPPRKRTGGQEIQSRIKGSNRHGAT